MGNLYMWFLPDQYKGEQSSDVSHQIGVDADL